MSFCPYEPRSPAARSSDRMKMMFGLSACARPPPSATSEATMAPCTAHDRCRERVMTLRRYGAASETVADERQLLRPNRWQSPPSERLARAHPQQAGVAQLS